MIPLPSRAPIRAATVFALAASVFGLPPTTWAQSVPGERPRPAPVSLRAPDVGDVRFAEPPGDDPAVQVAVRRLLGGPASPKRLVAFVQALSQTGMGPLELSLSPMPAPMMAELGAVGRVQVTVQIVGAPVLVGRLELTTDPERAIDRADSQRLARRVQAVEQPFALVEGHSFHPYLLRQDTERIRRYFIERGHPFVKVDPVPTQSPGLVDLIWLIDPGPQSAVTELSVTGMPPGVERPPLVTEPGPNAVSRPWVLEADAIRLRRHVCRQGFPEAEVSTAVEARGDGLHVSFVVEPGPVVRIAAMDIEAPELPASVLADLPLATGDGWCPDEALALAELLEARLAAEARPDAMVEVVPHTQELDGQVQLELRITGADKVRLDRIWFAGAVVTRNALLRRLVEVESGQLYDPVRIDDSVQNLRRTGLFRRVHARTLPGSRPGTRHVQFTLIEREPFSIDLDRQALTLHNLDLTDADTDVAALQAGGAFRGNGQRMVIYAQTNWQGLHLFDPYLTDLTGVELRLDRRRRSYGAGVVETWYSVELGGGFRFLADRLRLVPSIRYELTFPTGVPSDADVAVPNQMTVLSALGMRARLTFERLDAERVAYLGFRVETQFERAVTWLGGDIDLVRSGIKGRIRLPLWRFSGDRHLVLGLLAGATDLARYDGERIPAHLRLNPKIRGYDSLRFSQQLIVDDANPADIVQIGGTGGLTGGVELRIPMPYARRHALIPFFDGASLSDTTTSVLQDAIKGVFTEFYYAPGLTYAYSFFDERLEGFLQVAFPMRTDVGLEYVAFGMNGSF